MEISKKQSKYNELYRKEINTKQVKYNQSKAERIRSGKSLTRSDKKRAYDYVGNSDKSKATENEADHSRLTSNFTTLQKNRANMNQITRRHRAQLKQQITLKMHERRFMKRMMINKENRK